nr:protein chiffon [Leptinotarsa decemlineata]
MLERTRSYFDNVLSNNFNYTQDQSDVRKLDRTNRNRLRNSKSNLKNDDVSEAADDQIMTRKTRTRRPRIPALQSGYCAVCNLPYNNVEDHIQSKKHQKLIGGDANYIALNGSLNGFLENNSIPFLNLNGVDAIGVHETSFEELSPKWKKRTIPRTRTRSIMCDQVKSSPLPSTDCDTAGHHLRSRRNVSYMTPPSDDDSLEDHPNLNFHAEPIHPEYKEYRELRSSTRALAKLTGENIQEELWNSGRPKRTCIGKKRHSVDEPPPTTNCKTFYKVEVVSPKPRSGVGVKEKGATRRQQSKSPKRDEEKEKALIVKFKKMRNSELTRLNNEATNFLFPKKDDESSEEFEEVDDEVNTITSSVENDESISLSCSDNENSIASSQKFRIEDDHSMDSTCSSGRNKKKRRTHAEAFIMDNQKYYKFETPGSRLRYHGSYLPPMIKSLKHNGDCSPKREVTKIEEPEEKKMKYSRNAKVKLDNYTFSFEKVPSNSPWYSAFQRLDKGEQTYRVFSDCKYFL